MTAINEKYIRGPFKADVMGGIVWGPDHFHFADVRGWGELSHLPNAEAIQDANLQFMVDALNEKASGDAQRLRAEVERLKAAMRGVLRVAYRGSAAAAAAREALGEVE